MPQLGPVEIILILAIVILIFGANRLGEVGGALGKTVREFRREIRDETAAPAKPAESSIPAEKTDAVTPGPATTAAVTPEQAAAEATKPEEKSA